MKVVRSLVVFVLMTLIAFPMVAKADGLRDLPVQDNGRIKPFDTFARDMLHLVWGQETYKGKSAVDVVFSWIVMPMGPNDPWDNSKIVMIDDAALKKALGLQPTQMYFKPVTLLGDSKLGLLLQDLKDKTDVHAKLDPFYTAVETLEDQLSAYHAIRLGLAVRLVPTKNSNTWEDLTQMNASDRAGFQKITNAYIAYITAQTKHDPTTEKSAKRQLHQAVTAFIGSVRARFGDYANFRKIHVEVWYNHLQPFRWAWVFYLIAMILFSFAYFGQWTKWARFAWISTGIAVIFHITGFACRIYILDRPPVANMYETVVWVSFMAIVFAAIIYRFNRSIIVPLGATMVATLGLLLCDISSSVLDSSLELLQPVLRDNYWLMIHVLIIVSSYAAFFLAFFIGDICLFYFIRGEKEYQKQIRDGVNAIYRSIQVGVILLAAGIILGGIWADYSWGRFWSWDPKENWALIALLGYIVVLHGRIAGWLRQFGMSVAAVVAFSLVIMSWYGVNFVLGAGLHTYGFGAGGVQYVSAFVAAHLLYVAYVITLRQSRLKQSKGSANK